MSGLLLFSHVSFCLLLYLLCLLFYLLPNLVCLLFYTLRCLLHLLLYLFFYSRSASYSAKHCKHRGREEDRESSPHVSPSLEANLHSAASPRYGPLKSRGLRRGTKSSLTQHTLAVPDDVSVALLGRRTPSVRTSALS